MNWYKRSNLESTLPYFQEFEDMGDYVPKEQDVSERVREQFGADIVEDIGQGDSGVAYSLSNGDVLKITTNSQEGEVANYFMRHKSPHVVNYKSVWKEGDLYYIVMDKIDEMAVDSKSMTNIFKYIDYLMDRNKCYEPKCSYDIVHRDSAIEEPVKQEILSYLSALTKMNIPIFDFLDINNIGMKDGRLLFFDIT